MSWSSDEISTEIRAIVATNGQVFGSRLAALLKAQAPDWSPAESGARSLREFIGANVAGVVVAGRSGMDVIYSLSSGGQTADALTPTAPSDVDLWRAWVSPNSPHAIAADRTGSVVRAVPRGSTVEADELLLEPPGAQFHRELAQAFLLSVPDEIQAKLQLVLSSTGDHWWEAWSRELRSSEYLGAWNAFRRQKLEERLSSLLRAASVGESAIDAILKAIRERHLQAQTKTRRSSTPVHHVLDDEAVLRRLVAESVQHMSIADLRELRIPIGIVLDALSTSKSR